MLYHQLAVYKMWYMLTLDKDQLNDLFDFPPGDLGFSGRSLFCRRRGWVGICLNPEHIHNFPSLSAVLAHEITHCASFIMDRIDAWPESGNDRAMEPWCYLTEHLMETSIRWLGYE